MTTLMLYVGVAVTMLTVWGVIMVGSYLLGSDAVESSATADGRVTDTAADAERARIA